MFRSQLDSLHFKWKKANKKVKVSTVISVVLMVALITPVIFNENLIITVQAVIVLEDNSVDADSNIDSILNYGDDEATSYLNAQALDGSDQTILETITGGGGGSPIRAKILANESYPQWTSNGKLSDAGGGKLSYSSMSGQKNLLTDSGYLPYLYFSNNDTILVGDFQIQFRSQEQGGYQIITNTTSDEVEIEDQRFELQYWREQGGGSWRIIDMWQMDTEVSTADNDTTFPKIFIKRMYSDGEGNELNITYYFTPQNQIQLRFDLKVVDEDQYRIRFQSTGVAGDTTIVNKSRLVEGGSENITGGLQFANIQFGWSYDESANRSWNIEQQAGGKKVDIFLGTYELGDGENITIYPDTWGATETSDDCFSASGTYYDSSDQGAGDQIAMGYYLASVIHSGWIWSNVEAYGTAETGCFIRIFGTTQIGVTADGVLGASTDDTPTAWSSSWLPEDCSQESTTIEWDEAGTGTQDSPELSTMIQDRFDNNHDDGDDMAIVWITEETGPTTAALGLYSEDGSPGTGAELTIEFTPPNYRLEWEHQCQDVPYTVMDSFNFTFYGYSTDSEDYQIQLWNATSSDWINTSVYIEQSETWYNFSIDSYSGVVGSTITWRYLDDITTDDETQGTLRIDYAGILYWNYSIDLIETTWNLANYDATIDGWQIIPENGY